LQVNQFKSLIDNPLPNARLAHSTLLQIHRHKSLTKSTTMGPVLSWGCMIVVCVGAWWYYIYNRPFPTQRAQVDVPVRREDRKVKSKKEKLSALPSPNVSDQGGINSKSSLNGVAEKVGWSEKQKDSSSHLETQGKIVAERAVEVNETDDLDNQEFAKQLSSLKKGTSLTRPAQNGLNKKTRRANKQAARLAESSGLSSSQDISTNSSTTGADADDDLSPAASPPLAALSNGSPVMTSGDVGDMLETPSTGPSILRLTGNMEPSRPKQSPKPFQVQESKRQRQARRKNEERKADRAEAEKQRRALMEDQLRTARLEENRQKKSQTPKTNLTDFDRSPWKSQKETRVQSNGTKTDVISIPPEVQGGPTDFNNATLLDTLDQDESTEGSGGIPINVSETQQAPAGFSSMTAPMSGNVTISSTPNVAQPSGYSRIQDRAVDSWADDLPSEDEQLRRVRELNGNGGWNTVEKRPKKKPMKPKGDQASNESSDVGTGAVRLSDKPSTLPSSKDTQSTTPLTEAKARGEPNTYKAHPLDSDWTVA
jgi:hypothetical protein